MCFLENQIGEEGEGTVYLDERDNLVTEVLAENLLPISNITFVKIFIDNCERKYLYRESILFILKNYLTEYLTEYPIDNEEVSKTNY